MLEFNDAGVAKVFLKNGFNVVQTRYGQGHSFRDLDDLARQIGVALALRPGRLRGVEFRYIRRAMELTQAQVGRQFGRTEQTVANWEKRNQVPVEASLLLKQNCRRKFGLPEEIGLILDQQGKNTFGDARIVMEHDPTARRWRSNFHPVHAKPAIQPGPAARMPEWIAGPKFVVVSAGSIQEESVCAEDRYRVEAPPSLYGAGNAPVDLLPDFDTC